MKAIIVEDEFLAAIHAEVALESLGVEVIGTAEDSAGALQLAQQRPRLPVRPATSPSRSSLCGPVSQASCCFALLLRIS